MILLTLACTAAPVDTQDCDCSPADTAPAVVDTADTDADDTADSSDTADTADTIPPMPLQVYLLGGQSNMDGYAYVTGLPPELQYAQSDVQIYWSGRPVWSGLAPSSYTTAYGGERFGPEVTFGRTMADARPDATIALIKHAIGGTDLAECWYPGVDRTDPAQGYCYAGWITTVDAARAELDAAGIDHEIAGMIWMQGESDAYTESWANAYEVNLLTFIDRVRSDVEADEMPFAMGTIDCVNCPYRDTVRAAQESVADSSPLISAVPTDDLPQNFDAIHFDGSGMRTLGQRLAESLQGSTEPATTATPAFQFTGGALSNYTGNYVVGYEFQTDDWLLITGPLGRRHRGHSRPRDGALSHHQPLCGLGRLALRGHRSGGPAAG